MTGLYASNLQGKYALELSGMGNARVMIRKNIPDLYQQDFQHLRKSDTFLLHKPTEHLHKIENSGITFYFLQILLNEVSFLGIFFIILKNMVYKF